MRFRFLPLVYTLFLLASAKVFYTDKDSDQSVPLSINSDHIKVFQEKILGILGLKRPKPSRSHNNADEFASKFMSALYELMTENDRLESKVDNELGRVLDAIRKESSKADTIVSFIPDEIRASDESFNLMYETTFSLKNFNSGQLIAARLFIVRENAAFANDTTLLRVFRKTIGAELVEIGSQSLSNYERLALVSLNVTQLVENWLLSGQQSFPTQQKIYLELNDSNDTGAQVNRLKNLHCFGIRLFVDQPNEMERRIKRSLSINLKADESVTLDAKITDLNENITLMPRRLDKISAFKDKTCGLRSLYVDFRDLGWSDWIIAPQGYYADYCSGACEFPLQNTVTPLNHAIIQTLIHILDKRRTSAAKCAPIEFFSQNILFLNNEKNLVMKKYQNMRVKQCGCH